MLRDGRVIEKGERLLDFRTLFTGDGVDNDVIGVDGETALANDGPDPGFFEALDKLSVGGVDGDDAGISELVESMGDTGDSCATCSDDDETHRDS